MPCNPQTVLRAAESQIGYLEKKSNADLDSFTGNAGSGNYTKYNRDMKAWAGSAGLHDQWCQNFVDWCFVKAYGLAAAKALLGGFTNYTPTGSNWFRKRGLYTKRGAGKPVAGDVIYFYSSSKGRIGHVGIVKKVSGSKVYTIEGNTSGASSLVTNGGGVRAKSYSLSSTYIDGYGRPPYASVTASDGTPKAFPSGGRRPSEASGGSASALTDEVSLGSRILKNGMSGSDVKKLQCALIRLGYDLGKWGADGDFGDCTELAVRRFQTQEDLILDGEFGPLSLAALNAALAKLDARTDGETVRIRGGSCYVRAEPSIDAQKRGVVTDGARLPWAGEISADGWLKVVYKDKPGWVSGKYGRLET